MPLSDIKPSYSKIEIKIEAENDIKYNKKNLKRLRFHQIIQQNHS